MGHQQVQPALLMFGHWSCLPINFYFSTTRGMNKHQCVDHYVARLCEQLQEAFKEAQVQSISEAERQKQYYDRKANAISLEPGDLVLAKADTYRGRRKVKDWWEEEPYEVECQVAEGIPSSLMKNQWTGCSWVLHQNQIFLITPMEGTPLCMVVEAMWARWTTTAIKKQTPEGSETEEAPQSVNFLSPAQHQTGKSPLGWVNRKLCVFMWKFSGAFWLDKGWKVWLRVIGGVWKSMLACWQWMCWSHWWGLKDITGHNKFNPPLFILQIVNAQYRGCEMGTLTHALNFRVTTPSWIQIL